MNWINYVSQIKKEDDSTTYRSNFSEDILQIQHLKQQFNLTELPEELEELYTQTDGISEALDDNIIGELIWPINRVIETNKKLRSYEAFKELYMSFDQLLFFSDAGNGDYFGFITLNGKFNRNDVFVWDHETDNRIWVAPDLKTFIDWWLSGKIKV